MIKVLLDYFIPSPPNKVSRESNDALNADIKAAGMWGKPLGEANRDAVDVWVRHSDRRSREVNREWLKPRAKVFCGRWALLSGVLLLGAWITSGYQLAELSLTLAGFVAGCVSILFSCVSRSMNK
ncbi:hypothetical protein [Paraburkholderia humisilvae]|uniref:Uncharacterized protein n=1 Tax=Paraburkholderia humisilvae TaxID=627669 RepID=A0A6J5DNP3_9BURK|nr:hypothetical protein [Paraburkholderia humisilvae]CAB3754861.1 hypothetical protein LMG29542_02472 [Paraburkholderia humisilvae]